MTKTRDLDDQLKTLQGDADQQKETCRRSHEQLWQLLAKSYLWWREASSEQGYLDALYEQKNIVYRSDGNRPNFNPLMRIVCNYDDLVPSERVTISQWNKALQALDEYYVGNSQDLRHNPEGKLAAHIQSQGGVAGLTENVSVTADDANGIDVAPSRGRNRVEIVPNPNVQGEISRLALKQLKADEKGIGSAVTTEPVRVGGNGLLVLLARRDDEGGLTILGSSNDPSHIKAVAASVGRRDLTKLPPNLRALVEIIVTQAFPSHALPSSEAQRAKWHLTRYADKSDLNQSDLDGWKQDGRGRRLTSSQQLLLRGNNQEAIFSWSRVAVSPVTRCILNELLIENDDVVFLRVIERVQIEKWVETGEVALLSAEPEKGLDKTGENEKAKYKLPVTSAASGVTKNLHFYDYAAKAKATEDTKDTKDAKDTRYQVNFRRDSFKADWQVKLGTEWFVNLRQVWADQWFAGLGRFNQIARRNNATLALKVTPRGLDVFFNRHPDTLPPSEHFDFPTQIKEFKGAQATVYFSKDLAPVLFNLADAFIDGSVTMAGNCNALVFEYATQIGRFEIAIPTLDAKEKDRDGTLFYPLGRGQ